MKLLILASDPMEFSGIRKYARAVRRESLSVRWSRRASLNGHEVLLAANGVGATHAAAAIAAIAPVFRPDAIINTGYCGALDPALGIADLVIADRVIELAGSAIYACAKFAASSSAGLARGTVVTAGHVVQTAEEKERLLSAGARAVEMEACGAAARTHMLGLPFYCVKAVTDLAGETMANDFNAALRPDGHFATISILGRALSSPTVRLPELLRLRSRCARAARGLGDFFADFRF